MALELAGKNPAKFIFNDGVSETTVTIQPDDTPDAVRAKLQRVLELEAPQRLGAAVAAGVRDMQAPPVAAFTPADRAAEEARLKGVTTHGWNEDAGDDLAELPEV